MNHFELDIWLEIGREGRCFTYQDGLDLGVELGDLVQVRLRGRPMNGLVVGKHRFNQIENEIQLASSGKNAFLSNVEGIIQSAAVDSKWRNWLEEMAFLCHTSSFRMLKAALPPGWLGQSRKKTLLPKKNWRIALQTDVGMNKSLSIRQKELEQTLLSLGGEAWLRDLNKKGFSNGIVNNLIKIGRATKEKKSIPFQVNTTEQGNEPLDTPLEAPQTLTKEQMNAVDLFKSLAPGNTLLLWGVTGSGKTEVYLQIAAEELSAGRHCLVLTPEIGLIPQLVDRFVRRFGLCVLEYHSNCSEKERIATWRRILNSSKPLILIGTRSAIFLPLSPLGLIVLDEEHDSSYKQVSPMPCYHARELAIHRADKFGAKVVLGSATPSLSTWKNIVPEGPIVLAKLENRISRKPLPPVHVVDMREELATGNRGLISKELRRRLLRLAELNEQAVILVPKRGYSSFLSCRSCGEVVQCPNCDVALTVHRNSQGCQWLRCHWCDYRANIESCCNECGSRAFKPFGAGTQRVMEYLSRELEGLRSLRFDRDSTGGRDGHRNLLEKFAAGDADILIGTQMLAKGMDLPRVTLAVVLAADSLLHRPDLSAEEQALQLFMQLAGRAGRGELPGEVLVQTYCPNHPVINHLQDGRYEEFLKKELQLRRDAGLVPYSRTCLLRLAGKSTNSTRAAADNLAKIIRPICNESHWQIVGPVPALVGKVAGKSRWQLLLHGPLLTPLPLPGGSTLWKELPEGVTLSIDPDPLNL